MSRFLAAMTIGPVQGFIAASRKTRDLWFGSFLLSELSKAAAREVESSGGKLIFPCPESKESLEQESDWSVANIILAVKDGEDPIEFTRSIRKAVQSCWEDYCSQAYDIASAYIDRDIWNSQLDDVIEFYSAWVDFPENSDYASRRQRVMYLLGGRKNCRDFFQRTGRYGVEKSSLDGSRESVLRKRPSGSASLKLGEGEQLDLPGLVKRISEGKKHFPSVTRIACDSWIRKASSETREEFNALVKLCEELAGKNIIVRLKGNSFHEEADLFPYEGSCIYPGRYRSIFQEAGSSLEEIEYYTKKLETITGRINKRIGHPGTNCAVIAADGDKMGKAISSIKDMEEHQAFSVALSRFAAEARKVISLHHGSCIYTGGDDVLAMVPVEECLNCGRELHDIFSNILSEANFEKMNLTLSVGIAVCHFLESLEDIISFAREAERIAKEPNRNGLAVVARTRSNAPLSVREQWKNDPDSLENRLGKWNRLFDDGVLPGKLPYDLREIVVDYEQWKNKEDLPGAISAHITHILQQKGIERVKASYLLERSKEIESALDLKDLANELLLSQRVWCSQLEERR
jgi:CRISPR-associated protein Cmr2